MGEGARRVALLGDFLFPYGDAASNRMLALAKALREGGFTPVVVSRGEPRAQDAQGGRFAVEGIEYCSYAQVPAGSFRERLHRPQRMLEDLRRESGVDALILYVSASWATVPGMIHYCSITGLPLMADVAEWYSPRQFPHGLLDIRYYLFSLCFRLVFPRIRHMAVISRLLDAHFQKRGCNTVRIPAVVDCATVPFHEEPHGNQLRLLYAGSPGRKDLLGMALQGLLCLSDEELRRVDFTLLGVDAAQLGRFFGGEVPEKLRGVVHARGRVPVQAVSTELSRADFTVLLRENRRFTRAGFPSKAAESMAHGVPLLCTCTGDLALYLTDGRDCVEVSTPTAEAFAQALRRVLAIPPERLAAMQAAARQCAQLHFDYRNYIGALKGMVDGACARGPLRNTKR